MVTGSVAEEDAVPKAVVKAFAMLAMNLRNSIDQVELISANKASLDVD